MILKQPRTLVIDDRQDHGEKISQALNGTGYPARFILFNPDPEENWREEQLVGVRAVFLDLSLLGSNVVTDNDRAAAQSTLEQVLSASNGPWGLVAWTSHANDAQKLYDYLRERLPAGMRPISFTVLDKENWLAEFKRTDEDKLTELADAVVQALQPPPPVACLLGWEMAVQRAAASVLHQLTEAAVEAPGEAVPEEKLEYLLLELAKADAGKTLSLHPSLTRPLYAVLTPLLADYLDQSDSDSYSPLTTQYPDPADSGWHYRINRMLHIDAVKPHQHAPGALIELPINSTEIGQLNSLGTNDAKRQSRIRGLFFRFDDSTKKATQKEVSEKCKLFLMDITPSCDHAQAKAGNENYWRRFVVLCRIPVEHQHHLWRLSNKSGTEEEIREPGRMHAEHLYVTPCFSDESSQFLFVVNANLLISVPKSDLEKLPKPSCRIREQLFNHILSWLGRHITRQGIVSLNS